MSADVCTKDKRSSLISPMPLIVRELQTSQIYQPEPRRQVAKSCSLDCEALTWRSRPLAD